MESNGKDKDVLPELFPSNPSTGAGNVTLKKPKQMKKYPQRQSIINKNTFLGQNINSTIQIQKMKNVYNTCPTKKK